MNADGDSFGDPEGSVSTLALLSISDNQHAGFVFK